MSTNLLEHLVLRKSPSRDQNYGEMCQTMSLNIVETRRNFEIPVKRSIRKIIWGLDA